MAEETVHIKSGSLKIEGMLDNTPGEKAVIVTHPHPLYGGNMHSNVVEAVVETYRDRGYSTFRFNFRGAGQSEGAFDEGIGEQEDVRAALAYLSELGKSSIHLAGYSFGAWVNVLCLPGSAEVDKVVMISPPVNFVDFSFLGCDPRILLVIAGSQDDIAPPAMIEGMISKWNPKARFRIIQGADHFYGGKTGVIKEVIKEFLDREG